MCDQRQTKKTLGQWTLGTILAMVASLSSAFAQNQPSSELTTPLIQSQEQSGDPQPAPLTLTLQDALARAQKNDAQFLSSVTDAKLAHEDRVQCAQRCFPG